MSKDPARFEKLSQKLQEILKRLEENWEEQIREFEDLMEEMTSDRVVVVLDPIKDKFLDLFIKRVTEYIGDQGKARSIEYAPVINQVVDLIIKTIGQINDFWGPAHAGSRNHLEAQIQDVFLEECPEIFDYKEKITKELP